DLVGPRVLEHAVLVDAGLVRERVAADDRLVRLHRLARQRRQQLTRVEEPRRLDRGVVREAVAAHAQRHHELLERRVAGALADAVYRDLHLPYAAAERREAVRDGQAEIVVAVRAE